MKNINLFIIFILLFIFINGLSIASMAPNITETICFLGLDSILIGRTAYCNYPAYVETLPIIGTYIDIDKEKIIKLKPDIVLFSSNLSEKSQEFLDAMNIMYRDIIMEDINSTIEGIEQIVDITKSDYNIKSFKDSINILINKYKTRIPLKVYIEISQNPLMSCSHKSYIGDIVNKLGYNVMNNDKSYFVLSQEDIVKFNPDIIIIMDKSENIENRMGWKNINAIKNGKIIYLNDSEIDILSRPGPRIIKAIKIITERIDEIYD